MGVKAFDIAGYTYNADTYCPDCIIAALPTGDGQAFDGWATVAPFDGWATIVLPMSTEDNLSEIAYAFQIDRMDERSYDSGDFPKVIFESSVEDDICTTCGRGL